MKSKKSFYIIALVILIGILILISMIFISKNIINILFEQQKHDKEIEFFQKKAIEYMNNKYKIDFTAKIESEGFKKTVLGIDGSTFYCGHDKNIKEYIFEIKPYLGKEISYVTIHNNIEKNEIIIEETYGASKTDTSYKLMHELELLKIEILKVANQYYYSIEVSNKIDKSINGENDKIYVKLDYNYIEKNMDFITDIIELLQDRKTNIIINYNSIYIKINKETPINNIEMFYKFVKEIDTYMKENYNEEYTIYNEEKNDYSIAIKLNKKIKDEFYGLNKEKYSKMYKYLLQKSVESPFNISLEFNDEPIHIQSYNPDTIEEYYDKYIKNR